MGADSKGDPVFSFLSQEALTPLSRGSKSPSNKISKSTRWNLWFNTYRKLFTFIFIINSIGIGFAVPLRFPYAEKYPGALVLGNLLAATLVRNELFGRLLYLIVNTLFAKWTPLWWRLGCTSVLQHLGGIHSSCAISGLLWLCVNVVGDFRELQLGPLVDRKYIFVLVTGSVTNLLVTGSALSAIPWVRNTHHNTFERFHRFLGWIGIVMTWIFVILGDAYHPHSSAWNMDIKILITSQAFWFAICISIFVLLPWLFVREVPVTCTLPSPRIAILRFSRGMQQGLLGRISRSALLEYHAFGIVSEGHQADCHYMICGVQGDFTSALVHDRPKTIWTRELKFAGVSNTSTLYKRGIRICTGTGVGAALSTCLQSPDWFLIWIASDQEKSYGPEISGLIKDYLLVPGSERALIWDTKKRGGRPNVMPLLKEVWSWWGAEVVFITSNYEGNRELMEGCKEAGIHAFGTLWDF